MSFSGIKDVDREILNKLNGSELLKICSIDKYTWNITCDDAYLRRRIGNIAEIEKYKEEKESWKRFFLRFNHYVSKLEKEFNYIYTFGNFVTQYNLFKRHDLSKKYLLIDSLKEGELAIVIWILKNYHYIPKELALMYASEYGHLDIVKYLVEQGVDIHVQNDHALKWASIEGHLEIVKYLVEHGANIDVQNNFALRMAILRRHLEVVKYLVEHGADIHADYDFSLKFAREKGYLEISKYLVEYEKK